MARISKNEQQNIRRARNVEGWRALGIHDKIISQYDLRNKNPNRQSDTVKNQIKNLSSNHKRAVTREINKNRRKNTLLDAGYKEHEIPKGVLTSDTKMYNFMGKTNPNEIYNASSHLALAFTNRHGATAIMDTSQYKNLSFEEIKERLQERISDAEAEPDGSESMSCIFQMFSGTEGECENMLNGFSQRGYNMSIKKLTDRRYYRLVNRNDWTMREYAEMMLCVVEQAHNKDVPHLIDEFRDFVEENDLPFNEIFN